MSVAWLCNLAVMLLAPILGCQAPVDNLERVLERHNEAIRLLPAEARGSAVHGDLLPSEETREVLPEGEMTLEAARALAIRCNPDIHVAKARLELALARVAEARSYYSPNLVFSHSSTRTFLTPANRNRLALASSLPPTTIPSDITQTTAISALLNALGRPFSQSAGDGDTNSFSEHSTALTSSWLLFDGFVREAQLMASKHLYGATAQGLLDAQRLVTRSVDAAYYQVQLAREQIRITDASEQFSREQLEETRKLQEAGRASVADVDNFRVRALASRAELTAAEGLYENGRVILAELMGLEGSSLPADVDLSPLLEETPEELAPPAEDDFLALALANRPDLRQMEELLRAEEERVRAVYGLYQPVVSLSGTWGFNRTSNVRYEVDDQSSAAGLEVRWEIYNGGAREAQIRAAHSVCAEVSANLTRQRLAVDSQVRRAVVDVRNSQEEIELQRQTLITSLENRRIVQVGYVAGKETLNRLNEAQRDYITSDAQLALARIRLRQAWSDLRAAAPSEP